MPDVSKLTVNDQQHMFIFIKSNECKIVVLALICCQVFSTVAGHTVSEIS